MARTPSTPIDFERLATMGLPLASVVGQDQHLEWLGPGWLAVLPPDPPRHLSSLVHPADLAQLRSCLQDGSTSQIVVKGPESLPHLLRWQVGRGEEGRCYAQVEDITARLDGGRQRADALSQLLRSIVHDLRAPLRGVTGFAGLLARDLPATLTDAATADLGQIHSGVDRMTHSLDALHRLATAIVADEAVQVVALDDVVQQAQDHLADHVGSASITLRPLPCVCGRPTLLVRAFQQLLRNAVQAGASQVEIAADLPDAHGHLTVSIRDDGTGFDTRQLSHLVRPLRRLQGVPDPATGMGIGLAIVDAIVLAHTGTLEATSEPSAGATIQVQLVGA